MPFGMGKPFLLASAILFLDYCCSSDYLIVRSGPFLIVVTGFYPSGLTFSGVSPIYEVFNHIFLYGGTTVWFIPFLLAIRIHI